MDRYDALENIRWSPRSNPIDGPKRLCKFCILGVFLPVMFLCVPLYMRFLAFRPHFVNISPMDMKLLNQESTVSTIWCESQELNVNGTFNAYLLPQRPKLLRYRKSINMTRRMNLPDDIKEYWGFYLLKGSHVRLSVCSRYEGASFIVVKSLRDARRCAFLGELDSTEVESDEDSEEIEFMNEINVQTESSVDTEVTPPALTASREVLSNFMSSFHAMNIQTKQSVLSQMLKNLRQDPKSEEQLGDPRLLSNIVNIKKLLARVQNSTRGPENTTSIKNSSDTQLASSTTEMNEIEDGAFEDMEDDIDDTDGVKGLTDRGQFRQQTKNDRSKEETRSSWSSSEEALMKCEGLIYNIALNGDTKCSANHSYQGPKPAMTEIDYEVAETGFYYFIFANENEIVDNYLIANFNLQKTLFDVSGQIMNCTNVTGSCVFPLKFLSEDFVVLEAPDVQPSPENTNSTEYSECSEVNGVEGFTNVPECQHVMRIVSICQPRKPLYVVFVLLVPVLILLGASM